MISAIKSDNPIELLNYISNTFLECTHECASTSLACSLIQTVSLSVPPSLSLSILQSVSQCVMSLFCHSIRAEAILPRLCWPLARIGMAHICLFDIVAHRVCIYIYIFPRFSYQNVKWISMYFHHLHTHAYISLTLGVEDRRRKLICFVLSMSLSNR